MSSAFTVAKSVFRVVSSVKITRKGERKGEKDKMKLVYRIEREGDEESILFMYSSMLG